MAESENTDASTIERLTQDIALAKKRVESSGRFLPASLKGAYATALGLSRDEKIAVEKIAQSYTDGKTPSETTPEQISNAVTILIERVKNPSTAFREVVAGLEQHQQEADRCDLVNFWGGLKVQREADGLEAQLREENGNRKVLAELQETKQAPRSR